MAYASWSVVFGEQPSAAKWNILGTNDAAFNNGTGLPSANATAAYVATSEGTTSTSYADLATTTDTVTVTINSTGKAFVAFSAYALVGTGAAITGVSFAVSGATTIAAGTSASGTVEALMQQQSAASNINYTHHNSTVVSSLNTGSTTFKMKYKTSAGTGTFSIRRISVIPL